MPIAGMTRTVALASACALAGSLALLSSVSPALATPPTGALTGEKPPELKRERVPANLLKPLPAKGAVPHIVPPKKKLRAAEQAVQEAAAENFTVQLRALKGKHFGQHTGPARTAGLEQLRAYTDAGSFDPMWLALGTEKDDVRLAVLDHYQKQGDAGQGMLARVAIYDKGKEIRAEATRRIQQPPVTAVLQELDEALRSTKHEVVNNAGLLAGSIHAIETLPELIFAQFAQDNAQSEGDLAWIAIGTAKSYVQNLIPVTGDNSGAFNPVIGQVIEGVVLRVAGCVVTTYRADVHDSLVAMASFDTGQDLATRLDWDMHAWARWYNQEYVPMKQREDQELARAQADAAKRAAAAKS